MTAQPASRPASGSRYPDFDPVDQSSHWDPVTAGVVLARLSSPASFRFFTPGEQAVATALCDRLLDQSGDPRVPVAQFIDTRLAEQETDGWRYDDMPEDGQAWRACLRFLDEDAQVKFGSPFADCGEPDQRELIQTVQDIGSGLARPERGARLEPVDALCLHCLLRASDGVGGDRLSRPGLPARLQERRRGRA